MENCEGRIQKNDESERACYGYQRDLSNLV